MITNFSGFLSRIVQLLDGEDVSSTIMESQTLRTIARMGELRVYRDTVTRFNQKAFSALTTTANAATIPNDLAKITKIWINKGPLEPVTEEFLREYIQYNNTGDCRYFAKAGNQLIFGPALADGTTVNGRYQYRMDPLETNFNNPFFQAYEDLFVYAALVEGEPFYGAIPEKLQLWSTRYADIVSHVQNDEDHLATNAGPIRVRPSTVVLR